MNNQRVFLRPLAQATVTGTVSPIGGEEQRKKQLEWLKTHQAEYAGQYVAVDGDRLIGQGETITEARQQARQNGVSHPFLVRLTAENEVLFGGT